MGRRAWRQWRAVARFVLSQFCRNLPQGAGRQDACVERLPRFEFELLGLLVAGSSSHAELRRFVVTVARFRCGVSCHANR